MVSEPPKPPETMEWRNLTNINLYLAYHNSGVAKMENRLLLRIKGHEQFHEWFHDADILLKGINFLWEEGQVPPHVLT